MTARQYAMFDYIQAHNGIEEDKAKVLRQRTLGSLVRQGWVHVSAQFNFTTTALGRKQALSVDNMYRENIGHWSKYVLMPTKVTQMPRKEVA